MASRGPFPAPASSTAVRTTLGMRPFAAPVTPGPSALSSPGLVRGPGTTRRLLGQASSHSAVAAPIGRAGPRAWEDLRLVSPLVRFCTLLARVRPQRPVCPLMARGRIFRGEASPPEPGGLGGKCAHTGCRLALAVAVAAAAPRTHPIGSSAHDLVGHRLCEPPDKPL